MTEQQACTLCGAGGRLAAQCNMAMDLIRHIASLYSGKAIKGDFTQVYITGNEIWMAQQILASQQGQQRAALAQPSPVQTCTHPDCGRFYDHNAKRWACRAWADNACAADHAQPSPAPELPTEDELEAAGLSYPLSKEEAVALWNDRSGWRRLFNEAGNALKNSKADLAQCTAQRDVAQARVAELEKQEPAVRTYGALPPFAEKVLAKLRRFYDCAEDFESGGVDIGRHWLDLLTRLGLLNRVQRSPALWEISQQGEDLLEAPVAQAGQVPDVLFDGFAVYQALSDKAKGRTSSHNVSDTLDAVVKLMRAAAPQPASKVPQAWLDVQAERRRQIEAEGWTLEHDDQHKPGELAQAAVAYLLYAFPREAFDRTYAARLWPWISGFKPTGERRDLVRGLALGLAALERLDRAAAPAQGGSTDE